jgi:hypothetical protein
MGTERKASITKHKDGSGGHTINVIFHRFGDSPMPQDDGTDVSRTIAVVELEDGTIMEVDPKRVKFDVYLGAQSFVAR